jgi:DNA replication initiation complex subunit (GINS family)
MAEELTYKRLRDLAREEKGAPSLSKLPQDFYESVEGFLASKHGEIETSRSVLQMREFENAVATVKEICSVRQQKILFKAIRSGGVHGQTEEMTHEEHSLYDRFCAVLEDERGRLDTLLSKYGKRKEERNEAAKGEETRGETTAAEAINIKKVRFVKDVPAYKGPDNQVFGPFKPGQETELPKSEAEWLLAGKLAEAI